MSWTGFNWDGHEYPRFLADVSGDGRADIVGFGLNGVWVARSDGQGGFLQPRLVVGDLGYNQGWRVNKHPRFVAELGGRTSPPVVVARTVTGVQPPVSVFTPRPFPEVGGFGDAGVWVAMNNADGTFAAPHMVLSNLGYNQSWRVEKHVRLVADLTGDGKGDIVGFGDAGVWTA